MYVSSPRTTRIGSRVGRHEVVQRPAAGLGRDDTPGEVGDVDRLLGDRQVVPLEPAEDEQVLDDPEEAVGLRLDVRREIAGETLGVRIVTEPAAEQPGPGEDRRDRRPQLVRDDADERLLELLGLAFLGVHRGALERLAALVGGRREDVPRSRVDRPGDRPADHEHAAASLGVAEGPRDQAAHAGHRRQVRLRRELATPRLGRADLDGLAGGRGPRHRAVDVGGQRGLALRRARPGSRGRGRAGTSGPADRPRTPARTPRPARRPRARRAAGRPRRRSARRRAGRRAG